MRRFAIRAQLASIGLLICLLVLAFELFVFAVEETEGQNDERDMEGWRASLRDSTTGNFLEDCVSEPTLVSFPSSDASHISHGLFLQTPGDLTDLFEEIAPDGGRCDRGVVGE